MMERCQSAAAEVLIVTVTYKATEFIERYLLSVKELLGQGDQFRLVLIDNASPDNTVDVIRSFIAGHGLEACMTLVNAGVNGGFGFGCNMGSKQRTGEEYIWFVNPDTKIDYDAAMALVKKLDAEQDLAAAGSLLKNEWGEVRSGAFRFPTMGNALISGINLSMLERLVPYYRTSYQAGESLENVDWLTGASFMIRADVFEALNGFDEGYFLYFEELDLFYRFKMAGYRAASCENSVVFHASGSSTGVNRYDAGLIQPRRPKYWYESRCRFYLKHFGRAYLVVLNSVHVLATIAGRTKDFLLRRKASRVERYLRDIMSHSFFTPDKLLHED